MTVNKNTGTKINKRAYVRMILNRTKIYSLSFYARKASAKVGRVVTVREIKMVLRKMAKEGLISFSLTGGRFVVGFSI